MNATQVTLQAVPSVQAGGIKTKTPPNTSFSDVLKKEGAHSELSFRETMQRQKKELGERKEESTEIGGKAERKVSVKRDTNGQEETKVDSCCKAGEETELQTENEEKEKPDPILDFLLNLITDLSFRIGKEPEEVKKYLGENVAGFQELLDINTWREFILDSHQLSKITDILTNDKAFQELQGISELLETFTNSGEMKRLTAGTTEGSDEFEVLFRRFLGEVETKTEQGKEIAPEEGKTVLLSENAEEPIENVLLNEEKEGTGYGRQGEADRGIPSVKENRYLVHAEQKLFSHVLSGFEELSETSRLPEGVSLRELLGQVTTEIRSLKAPDRTTLEMMLQPATLGKVLIHVTNKNGVMQAEIRVENTAAKTALENNLIDLKLSFEEQGFKVEEVNIMLSDSGIGSEDPDRNNEEGTKKNKGGQRSKTDASISGDREAESVQEVNTAQTIEKKEGVDLSA